MMAKAVPGVATRADWSLCGGGDSKNGPVLPSLLIFQLGPMKDGTGAKHVAFVQRVASGQHNGEMMQAEQSFVCIVARDDVVAFARDYRRVLLRHG